MDEKTGKVEGEEEEVKGVDGDRQLLHGAREGGEGLRWRE